MLSTPSHHRLSLLKSFHDCNSIVFHNYYVLFIFGCAGSSLLCSGFSYLCQARATLQLRCTGFSLRWLLLLQSMSSGCAKFSGCGSRALLCVCALVAQSCWTLCNTIDCSPPGSSVHAILQARILEWFAIPFSRESPHPGIKPGSPALQADSLLSEPPHQGSTGSTAAAFGLSCFACGIFLDQGSNPIPCIGRRILIHCATREVQLF